MAHRYNYQTIEVSCEEGRPVAFRWRKSDYIVMEVVDRWELRTLWWQEEVHRIYYQVITSRLGIYSLFKERGTWYLDAII